MCTTDIPMTIWHLTNNLERLDGLRLCEFNDDELLALHRSLQQIDHEVNELLAAAVQRIVADAETEVADHE
nr:hypothetical protein [Propionicimonas sp.]